METPLWRFLLCWWAWAWAKLTLPFNEIELFTSCVPHGAELLLISMATTDWLLLFTLEMWVNPMGSYLNSLSPALTLLLLPTIARPTSSQMLSAQLYFSFQRGNYLSFFRLAHRQKQWLFFLVGLQPRLASLWSSDQRFPSGLFVFQLVLGIMLYNVLFCCICDIILLGFVE